MASLIGSSPSQLSTNGMLGELAFQNSSGATIQQIQSPVGIGSTITIDNFPTSGSTNDYTNLTLQPIGGNVIVGAGSSLATGATNGFICIPTCAGAPSGSPPAIPAGSVPLIYDTTNDRLYIRTPGGTWRYATTTT